MEEAEAQCAVLDSASLCDGCFTSDSDIFLFGAKTVYRDIVLGESGYVVCYEMADIERKLGFGRNSLISLALLLGSDYSAGVHGFGPETACKFVKSIGDESVLRQIMLDGVGPKRKKKEKEKSRIERDFSTDIINNENNTSQELTNGELRQNGSLESQFAEVINAYLRPKCHSPDSKAVQRVMCTQEPFMRSKLHEICEKYFGWSPEKTDQYILPKIAERDLRRFANLRAMSSALGVNTPLHELQIPIQCPVTSIVKQRKVKGRDYYDVSWRNINGLQISTIPGDLIQSACPEKLNEFLGKKGEHKKNKQTKKPLPRKQINIPANTTSEIDKQLQDLLLCIESESKRNPLTDITNRTSKSDIIVKDLLEPDVIDLSTPSPPVRRACKVAMCQKPIGLDMDVIDVCDSEDDVSVSPEHERKARELRLFLDSIKGDLY